MSAPAPGSIEPWAAAKPDDVAVIERDRHLT